MVDDYHTVQAEIEEWIQTELDPLLKECKTYEQLAELKWQTALKFGGSPCDYRMPSSVFVQFALHYTRFLDKTDYKKE